MLPLCSNLFQNITVMRESPGAIRCLGLWGVAAAVVTVAATGNSGRQCSAMTQDVSGCIRKWALLRDCCPLLHRCHAARNFRCSTRAYDACGRLHSIRLICSSACSLSSGSGSMDCNMIDGLLKSFPKVANTVLEPAKDHIDAYKKLAVEKGYNTSDWKWRQQGWDDFVGENGGKQKYHFISSIHSLYYMDDLEKTVLGMLDRLEEGGVLMAIMVADDSGFRHLWHHFSISDEMFTPYHSSSVQKILEKHGYEFKVVPQESYVDVTSCFEEGNVIGRLVVNFLLHVVDFHESAPADFVEEVMAYLGGPECSVKRGDKRLFNNFWDAILVTKNSKTGSK